MTVQTFPFALGEIRADSALKERRLAVIAAEAHSSQSGQIFQAQGCVDRGGG
ncbi:hypothetical protein [Phytohabitans houttuyneae]|uniref:hypothetical protein n=1 Tax=Phytohabitans houttuyneae TaxID=1076126 RepID=UPI001C4990FF|nr:hypothetical protein [Phytohabitans houttuyneae]